MGFALFSRIFHLPQLFTKAKLLDGWLLLIVAQLSLSFIWKKTPWYYTLLLLLCLPF